MPMDGFTLSFITRELQGLLIGGRVDKVSQPERDSLLLLIRSQGSNHKLLLSASANHARAQITTESYENPAQPPMFCMLMRKHLTGSHLTDIQQIGGDRILSLRLEGLDELGDPTPKTLYLEMMGRHSNLTLVDASGTIIDSIKHVNSEMSRIRTVLPGQVYHLPPQQQKLDPALINADQITRRFSVLPLPLAKAMQEVVAGMACVCAKEVCAQLDLDGTLPCSRLNWDLVSTALEAFFQHLPAKGSPMVLLDETGLVLDFFPFPYRTFAKERQERRDSLCQAMDDFYLGRDLHLRMRQRSADLQKHIKNAIDRLEKKQGILLQTILQSDQAEENRIFGELLTANLHLVEKGAAHVSLPNYYDPNLTMVMIPLMNHLTPAQNAQQFYKKYRKAKVGKEHAAQQIQKAQQELLLLENALEDLEKCNSNADLSEIRQLLTENGYLKPDPAQRKRKKALQGKPYRFISPDGTEILVGKNALQNDRLTFSAEGNALWLHAQGIPGSHVLIRSVKAPSDATLLLAGKLAVYFSKGRHHPAQPVDYTMRKHVKKVPAAPAGFVTYTHFQTLLIGLSPEDMVTLAKLSLAA